MITLEEMGEQTDEETERKDRTRGNDERKMAVGPSCFVRRETRELSERRRQGLPWGSFGDFFCLNLMHRAYILVNTEEELRGHRRMDNCPVSAKCED